jgi:hypothetical protein
MPEGYSVHAKLRRCNTCGKKGYFVSKTCNTTVQGKKVYCGTMRVIR